MKNNRTFLEKLLDGAEVKWIPLGDVADYEQPTKYLINSTVYNDNYPTPVLTAGKTFILGYTNEDEGIYFASKSPVIIFDDFTTANKWVDFDFKAKSSAMKMITSKNEKFALLKYIYYWLNTLPNNQTDGDHKRQWISNYANKLIPIPPLPVQTEIVKILDALTALTSELTLRRKQYEYYREKLLSEEELEKVGGKWKNLKDVLINLRTGLNPRNNFKLNTDGADNYYITVRELDSVNIKITDKTDKISNQAREIIDKRSKLNIGDILFSGTGTIGKTAFISELPRNWNIKEGVYALTVNQEIIKPMYLLRLLQSEITKKQINNFVMGSTVKSISMADLKKVKILIPSLDEQQRIVSILDKFEALTNSITEGLPLSIEQSQKRYEYYRELLLDFS